MSANLKLSNQLFLGREELNHLKSSLKENGYEAYMKHAIRGYGVGYTIEDTARNSFRVMAGSGGGNISILPGYAIDRNLNIIQNTTLDVDVASIPSDGSTYFVLISNGLSVEESGTVDVDASGVLSGTGTMFTEVLRGLPNFPSKISFPNSSVNTDEYTVASVNTNVLAQLNVASNSLTAESGMEYSIVGTFNRGHLPPAGDKYPLEKNSYTVTVSSTDSSNGETVFALATATYDGSTLKLIDQRSRNILSTGSGEDSNPTQSNILIGLEQSTYGGVNSDGQRNLIRIGWGFRSIPTQWSSDIGNQQITITGGSGGIWGDLSNFTNGDWNNWYVWVKNDGNFLRIFSSTLIGSDVRLDVDYAATISTSSEIAIVPDAHEIEFLITNSTNPTGIKTSAFPIHQGEAQFEIEAGLDTSIMWRNIKGENSTQWSNLNDGNYFNEDQFNSLGVISGTATPTAITGSSFTPLLNPLNHQTDKASRSNSNIFLSRNTFSGAIQLGGNRVLFPNAGTFHNSNIFNGRNKVTAAVSSTSGIEISGFSNATQGSTLIVIENDRLNSTGNVTLLHQNSGSSSGNRMNFSSGENLILRPGEMATLIMDETGSPTSRWTLHSTSASNSWRAGSQTIVSSDLIYSSVTSGVSLNAASYNFRKDGDTIQLAIELNIGYADTVAVSPEIGWTMNAATIAEIGASSSNFSVIPGSASIFISGSTAFNEVRRAHAYLSSNVLVIAPSSTLAITSGTNVLYHAIMSYQI